MNLFESVNSLRSEYDGINTYLSSKSSSKHKGLIMINNPLKATFLFLFLFSPLTKATSIIYSHSS